MSLPTLDDDNRKKNNNKMSLPSIDMPPIGSETDFKELPVNEALYEEDDREMNEDIYDEADRIEEPVNELPTVNHDEDDYIADENDYYPEYEQDLEDLEKDKFIDKKKKRLIPFGGKKSNRNRKFVKSSDFDDRKNKLAQTKIMQFSILVIIAILFLVGLKNTFLPSHVYTANQIRQFAAEGAGQTGFPEERGKAYVESFMEAYLTFDRTRPELNQSLSYFYGQESLGTNYPGLNTRKGPEAKQHIIIAPSVYEVDLLTEYSAQYKVSTYVSNNIGEEVEGNKAAGRWLSFSVNLYYDEEKDSLSITPDSPTIIPSYRIANPTIVPDRKGLGNGQVNKDILPALAPTINGFLEAYAKTSVDSHDAILQYIDDKNDVRLYDGFGGAVELNGNASSAIKSVVYNTDNGMYAVDVTVKWIDTAAIKDEELRVEYTARYIMEIKPIEDGKYAVYSFAPYTYYK